MENKGIDKSKVRESHFPLSTFLVTLGCFLLISGFHTGLILLINKLRINDGIQTFIIISYWILVAVIFTMITRSQMKNAYEQPIKNIAKATSQVANGDFSVYVPLIHRLDQLDYLDVMIMDFNKMVEELGSIETLKTDFLSNVSHEIKTPIAVIQNSAEMLKSPSLSFTEQHEYVTTILQSSKKLSSLITNILKLNKLEKQNIQPELKEYDLAQQLCDCSLQFEQVWEEKDIDFEVDIEDRVLIIGDADLLELVWTNLLSNALKFTKKGGTVSLSQRTVGHEVIVMIRDNGCGMSESTMQHIFDKFYQGDTSHSMEGNGLGLALALRIIRMMEGTITVESEVDRGTLFTVKLPINHE